MKSQLPAALLVLALSALGIPSVATALPETPPCEQQCITHPGPNPLPLAFGYSIAISGDTVAVGSFDGDVTILVKNGGAGAWVQQAILTGSAANGFGNAVAIDGDTLIIGAPGAHNDKG